MTVRVAFWLGVLPASSVINTLNWALISWRSVPATMQLACVAPAMSTPFFRH